MDGWWHRIEEDLGSILTKGKLIKLLQGKQGWTWLQTNLCPAIPLIHPKLQQHQQQCNNPARELAYFLKQMHGQRRGHSSSASFKLAKCHWWDKERCGDDEHYTLSDYVLLIADQLAVSRDTASN